jgi:hypothetical protein
MMACLAFIKNKKANKEESERDDATAQSGLSSHGPCLDFFTFSVLLNKYKS